jgi:hypothetical protein
MDPEALPATGDSESNLRSVPTAEPLSAVVARFNLAIRKQDWALMRACCCDDAIIDSVTAGKALGPDETVAAVRAAYSNGVYAVEEWAHEDLAEEVALSSGGVRYRPAAGRMRDAVFYWLSSGKDGKLWRVKAFGERDAALAHFERHGRTLDL